MAVRLQSDSLLTNCFPFRGPQGISVSNRLFLKSAPGPGALSHRVTKPLCRANSSARASLSHHNPQLVWRLVRTVGCAEEGPRVSFRQGWPASIEDASPSTSPPPAAEQCVHLELGITCPLPASADTRHGHGAQTCAEAKTPLHKNKSFKKYLILVLKRRKRMGKIEGKGTDLRISIQKAEAGESL